MHCIIPLYTSKPYTLLGALEILLLSNFISLAQINSKIKKKKKPPTFLALLGTQKM